MRQCFEKDPYHFTIEIFPPFRKKADLKTIQLENDIKFDVVIKQIGLLDT